MGRDTKEYNSTDENAAVRVRRSAGASGRGSAGRRVREAERGRSGRREEEGLRGRSESREEEGLRGRRPESREEEGLRGRSESREEEGLRGRRSESREEESLRGRSGHRKAEGLRGRPGRRVEEGAVRLERRAGEAARRKEQRRLSPQERPLRDNRRSMQTQHLSEKEKARRREAHRRKVLAARACLGAAMLALVVFLAVGIVSLVKYIRKGNDALPVLSLESVADMPEPIIKEDFLPFNEYSRPGTELPTVKKVFIHYTANPGTTAQQNRDYFAGLSQSHETSASSHYVIGYNGEIIQCLPLKEIGYAVKGRNFDSLSIECCYLEENGVFTEETYGSLLKLTAWLLQEYRLTTKDVLRHYDEGGKNCPKFYVENEEAWKQFQLDLYQYIEEQNEKAAGQ